MRQRKASGGIPSKYLLMILSIVCIMLLFFSYSTGFSGGPLESVANHIFIPMQKGIDYVGSTIAITSADTKTRNELVKENEELQKQVEDLNSTISNMELKLKINGNSILSFAYIIRLQNPIKSQESKEKSSIISSDS